MAKKNETKDEAVLLFTKKQIVESERYEKFRDFLNGILETDQMYSLEQVDEILIKNNLMKGKGE